jgi:hypothetical protein
MLARAKWLLQILQLAKLHYDNPLDSSIKEALKFHPGFFKTSAPWDVINDMLRERREKIVSEIFDPVFKEELEKARKKLHERRNSRN